MKLNIIFQNFQTRCQRTTHEDPPISEDAREIEEDEEAAKDVSEPKVAPTIRTTAPPSSRETVRTWKATHLTVVTTKQAEKYVSMIKRIAEYVGTE